MKALVSSIAATIAFAAGVAVLLAVGSGLVAAQTYKWTDENGKVHFSDSPPPDRKADPVTIKPAVPANPATAGQRRDWQAQLEESRMRGLQAQQQKDADERKAKTAEYNCVQARRQLDTLVNGRAIYSVDKDGQRQYLDDKDRPARIRAAQERAEQYCR
jgi:hypothetical protein